MPRIFSGIQPSGELHIGNYLGAVKNWVQLQHEIESFICVVDYHAITGVYEPEDLRRRTMEMALSLMAAGIDPNKATLFVQSRVPEHTELAWIFNTVTPLGELERPDAVQGQGLTPGIGPGRHPQLPGAPGGRHPALQGRPGSRGRGPGTAPRALSRNRAPLERADSARDTSRSRRPA
jgi:hypothetical protein